MDGVFLLTKTIMNKLHIMMKPSEDWLTKPPAVAAIGNPVMAEAVGKEKVHKAGEGAQVISELAALYQQLGVNVAVFESSKAAEKVSARVIGAPNPDYVFTVDYCKGNELGGESYVNIVNGMTAPTRWLEPFVMKHILAQLGVGNVLSQPVGALLEGGDYDFSQNAFGPGQSLLVTGSGANSRTNEAGAQWLKEVLKPEKVLDISSTMFHRDLVSVLVQDTQGHLVQALLAEECIGNAEAVKDFLLSHGVDVVAVAEEVVANCALNLVVNPGLVIGMQTNGILHSTLGNALKKGVEYHALPEHLQKMTGGFVDMQGGANCVSGHVIVEEGAINLDPGHIAEINASLHGKNFEDYLQATAEELDMAAAIHQS